MLSKKSFGIAILLAGFIVCPPVLAKDLSGPEIEQAPANNLPPADTSLNTIASQRLGCPSSTDAKGSPIRCEKAGPIGWSRQTPDNVYIDTTANSAFLNFQSGIYLTPSYTYSSNPSSYQAVVGMYFTAVGTNTYVWIHSPDGFAVDGMVFRKY